MTSGIVVGQQLQQPVRARQAGLAAADDRHADLDALVLVVELALDELLLRVDGGGNSAGATTRPFGDAMRAQPPSWPSRPR